MQKDTTEDARSAATELIAKLESTPINSYGDLKQILANTMDKIEKSAHPLKIVKLYLIDSIAKKKLQHQPWCWRALRGIQFEATILWAICWDVLTRPTRPSRITANMKDGTVTVEEVCDEI